MDTSTGDTGIAPLRLRFTALSDVGRVRKDNQDSGYAGPYLLAIADGVGGSARGDVASHTAIAQLRSLDKPPGDDPLADLRRTVDLAHRKLAELVETAADLDGTSTTATIAVLDGTRLAMAHIGDSRAYLLRDGVLTQLTTDHTFVQTLVDEGRITEAESRVHPHRHLILKALDGVHDPEPDLFFIEVQAGDRVLVCSDGANGALTDEDLARLMAAGTVEKAAVDLVRGALDAGSSDNVTVVVADVIDTSAEDPDETQAVQVGPLVVGAAATPRKLGRRKPRRADTGELEPIPASPEGAPEGAIVTDVDPETIRYAPQEPRRFGWLRIAIVTLVLAVLAGVAIAAGYTWSQRQYYVGDDAGTVVIFRGVQADVPVLTLRHVAETSQIEVDDLPAYSQSQVRAGMAARNLAAARGIVRRLGRQAVCSQGTSGSGSTPSPTPSPSATVTPGPTAIPSATPGATPTTPAPSASPSSPTSGPTSSTDCADTT